MKRLNLTILFLTVCMICGCSSKSTVTKDTESQRQEAVSETPETAASENPVMGYYKYPDTEGMREEQIRAVCRIPETTLNAMSSEQLAQAVADYPLLWEIELDSSGEYEYAVDWLKEQSDAYRKLLDRKDAKDVLIEKTRELEESPDNAITVELLKKVIFHETIFQNELTDADKEYLDLEKQVQ